MTTAPASRFSRLARMALPALPLALASTPAAQAAIIYTDANDLTFSYSDSKFLWVDMGTGGLPGAASLGVQDHTNPPIASPSFYLWFSYSGGRPEWVSNDGAFPVGPQRVFDGLENSVAVSGNYIRNLTVGDVVSDSLDLTGNYKPFRTNGTNGTPWTPGTTGFIGVKFNTNSTPLFGWVQISYNLDQSVTVHDFAYESSGAPIALVPEPSNNAVLAGLLAGSAALWRKRRKG